MFNHVFQLHSFEIVHRYGYMNVLGVHWPVERVRKTTLAGTLFIESDRILAGLTGELNDIWDELLPPIWPRIRPDIKADLGQIVTRQIFFPVFIFFIFVFVSFSLNV